MSRPQFFRGSIEFTIRDKDDADRALFGELRLAVKVWDAAGAERTILLADCFREDMGTRKLDYAQAHLGEWLFGDREAGLKALEIRIRDMKSERESGPPLPPRKGPTPHPATKKRWPGP